MRPSNHFRTLRSTAMLLVLAISAFMAHAQSPKKTAVEDFSYTFVSSEGTNATAVVWIPSQSIYVTAIAGNAEFPFEAFDVEGNSVWTDHTNLDLRGMWWNAKSGRLEANGAGEDGWYKTNVTADGTQGEWEMITAGQHQPDFQSALTRTPKNTVGYFEGYFYLYDTKKGKLKKEVELTGFPSLEKLNLTTVAYTGNDSYPLALLNFEEGKIEFFDLAGKHLGSTALPGNAVTSDMFRFAFANGRAFTYDVDTRTWTAYKVF